MQVKIDEQSAIVSEGFNRSPLLINIGEHTYHAVGSSMIVNNTKENTVAVILTTGLYGMMGRWLRCSNGKLFHWFCGGRYLGARMRMQPGTNRIEHRILCQSALFIAFGKDSQTHWLTTANAYGSGGTVAQIQNAMFRAAVIDLDNHLKTCIFVGHQEVGAKFYLPVGSSEPILVEDFATGSLAAFELVVIESALVSIFGNSIIHREFLCICGTYSKNSEGSHKQSYRRNTI